MSDVRRFDGLERTVAATARRLDEQGNTLLSRLSSHAHTAADLVSGVLDLARLPIGRTGTSVPAGDHDHNRDAVGETRYTSTTGTASAPSTAFVSAGLGFTLSAGARYRYEAELFYAASATADFRVAVSGPSGYSGRLSLAGRDTAATTGVTATSVHAGYVVSDQPSVGGVGTTTTLRAVVTAVIDTAGNAGAFQLFFNQAATDASNPTLLLTHSNASITRLS